MQQDQARLVSSAEEAKANIARYQAEVPKAPALQEIMAYARAWYAIRNEAGGWSFAPGKFAGYVKNDAQAYVVNRPVLDGRQTERALADWFEEVPSGTSLRHELDIDLRKFCARYGRTPNRLARVSVPAELLASQVNSRRDNAGNEDLLLRITIDSDICAGRPCIRGMRIRVADIVGLLAAGESTKTILADYPYLEAEDITAALFYAARATAHRVVKAA
jgi:uncharacterized protein (DUF433 family)